MEGDDDEFLSDSLQVKLLKSTQLFSKYISEEKLPVILDLLETEGCLVQVQKDAIRSKDTFYDKVSKLVDCMKGFTIGQINIFVRVLENTDVGCLALAKKFTSNVSGKDSDINKQKKLQSNTPSNRKRAAAEQSWCVFDCIFLDCSNITPETVNLLEQGGYSSILQLKNESDSKLNEFLQNPPFNVFQLCKLLNLIRDYSEYLKESNYLAQIPMTDEHCQKLKNNVTFLTEKTDVKPLLNRMTRYKALDCREILKLQTVDQIKTMIQFLQKKRDISYYLFLQALHDTDQGHIAHALEIDPKIFREVDCCLKITFAIKRTNDDEYVNGLKRLIAFERSLHESLNGSKKEDTLRRLGVLETYRNKIRELGLSSVYIFMKSADGESVLDLKFKEFSGQLQREIRQALQIDKLMEEFQLPDLITNIQVHIMSKRFTTSWPVACLESSLPVVESLVENDINMYEVDKFGRSALHWACAYSSLEIVKFLIAEGADICARDYDGQTILMSACQDKCLDKVRYLVESGHDVNDEDYKGNTALHMAAASSSVDVLEFLISEGASLIKSSQDFLKKILARQYKHTAKYGPKVVTPLHLACAFNTLDVVTNLMERTRNYDISELLWMSCFDTDLEKVKFIHARGGSVTYDIDGYKLIHLAAEFSSLSVVKFLVQHGADVNERSWGGTTLMFACNDTDIDKVEYFLSQGCDVNQTDTSVTSSPPHAAAKFSSPQILESLIQHGADIKLGGNRGRSVLHSAAASRYTANINFCLQHGLDVNKPDIVGETPLHICAKFGTVSGMECLVTAGADVNVTDYIGRTILNAACEDKSLDKLKLCVSHGLDVNKPDEDGDTPLHLAARYGTAEMMEYLIQAGADVKATGDKWETILQAACKSKSVRKIKLSIEKLEKTIPGDTSISNAFTSALYTAINADNYPGIIYLLLTGKAHITLDKSSSGMPKKITSLMFWTSMLGVNQYINPIPIFNRLLDRLKDKNREIWLSFLGYMNNDQGVHTKFGHLRTMTDLDIIYVTNPLCVQNQNDGIIEILQQQENPNPSFIHSVKQRRDQVPSLYKLTRACIRRHLSSGDNILHRYKPLKDADRLPTSLLRSVFLCQEMKESLPHLSSMITLSFNALDCDKSKTHRLFDITKADGQEALDYRHAVLRLLFTAYTRYRSMQNPLNNFPCPSRGKPIANFDRFLQPILHAFIETINQDTNISLIIQRSNGGDKLQNNRVIFMISLQSEDIWISKGGGTYYLTHSIHVLKGVRLPVQRYVYQRLRAFLHSEFINKAETIVNQIQFVYGHHGELHAELTWDCAECSHHVFNISFDLVCSLSKQLAEELLFTEPFFSPPFATIRDKTEKSVLEIRPCVNKEIDIKDENITSEWELSPSRVDDILWDFINTISPNIQMVYDYTKSITDAIIPKWEHKSQKDNVTYYWDRNVLDDRVLLNLVLWEVKEHPDSWETDNLPARVTSLLNSLSTWKYTDCVTGKIQDSLCVDNLSETSRNNLQREMSDDLNSVKQVLGKQTTGLKSLDYLQDVLRDYKIYVHFNDADDNLMYHNTAPPVQDVLYYEERYDYFWRSDMYREICRLIIGKISKS